MTTVGDAIKNSWLHVFSFDTSIPRGYQKETIKEVLGEINRIKDEMHTIHLRFSDLEQGKLDISTAHQLENQFEKLKQQLQLHTLLISELKKQHLIINELSLKNEERINEEKIIRNEMRDLKNEVKKLTERDNKITIERINTLESEFKNLLNKSNDITDVKNKLESMTSQIESLQSQKLSCKENIRNVNELKEDFSDLITNEIPELKAEIQRKMNKTIAATNELKSNYNDILNSLNVINEERIQDKNSINELLSEAQGLRLQIQNIKKIQVDDNGNRLKQDDLINQCVSSIAKLANSINNLQEKISQHLITLKGKVSVPTSPFNGHNEFTEIKKQSAKNRLSLPETPSTQAPPLANNKIGAFFNINGHLQTLSSSSTTKSIGIDEATNTSVTTLSTSSDQNFLAMNDEEITSNRTQNKFSGNINDNKSEGDSRNGIRTPLPKANFRDFLKGY